MKCRDMANGFTLTLLVVYIMAFLLICVPVGVQANHGPRSLELYAHESFVTPTATVINSAIPSGSTTGADEFGLIRTISNVLKVGSSKDSPQIGSQTGIIVIGKDLVPVYISFTYFLNKNATYQGTIAVHGHIDGASTEDMRFAVVGGTGDFLSVTGEDRAPFTAGADVPDPSSVVNIHHLTLRYLY